MTFDPHNLPPEMMGSLIESMHPRIAMRDGRPLLVVMINDRAFSVGAKVEDIRDGLVPMHPHFEIVGPSANDAKPHFAGCDTIITLARAFAGMIERDAARPGPIPAKLVIAEAAAWVSRDRARRASAKPNGTPQDQPPPVSEK